MLISSTGGLHFKIAATKSVPHRQWVFSIPKRLRPWFSHDRKLLAGLSKCAWKILGQYLKHSVPYDDAVAGSVVAVQTFGDFQNFNAHLHIIVTDGSFYGQGRFQKANQPCPSDLEPLFRQEVFRLPKAHGLPDRVIENMMDWHHGEKRGQFHLIDEECGIACNILTIK